MTGEQRRSIWCALARSQPGLQGALWWRLGSGSLRLILRFSFRGDQSEASSVPGPVQEQVLRLVQKPVLDQSQNLLMCLQRFGKGSSAAGNNFTKFCGGSASGFWISSNKAQRLTPSHLRLTPSQQSRRGPLIFLLLLLISILPRSLGRGTESDWLFVRQPGDSRAAAPVHLRTSLEFRNEKLLVFI